MVPVGVHHDSLVPDVRSPEDAPDIPRLPDVIGNGHVHIALDLEGETPESGLFGGRDGRVHIHSGGLEEFPGAIFMEPSFDGELVGVARVRVV